MARYPLPIDTDHIDSSSNYFQLQAALAYIAYLSREGVEITSEKILALLKELGYLFEEVDSDAEKLDEKQEEERKKIQEEISRHKKLHEQIYAQYVTQREDIAAIIEEFAVSVKTLPIEEVEEYAELFEEKPELSKG